MTQHIDCSNVKRRLSLYVDRALPSAERRLLQHHLIACRACSLESERYFELRVQLRALPRYAPPADLTTRLRVVASKVRMESLRRASPWSRWRDRIELTFRNLMRPVALPAVGGLCSAIFIFGTFVPMFNSVSSLSSADDIPTMLTTPPSLKYTGPVAFSSSGDALVDLQLDEQGQVVDFKIVSETGQPVNPQANDVFRRTIENGLLFTSFSPATTFGRGVASTIRIFFRSSRIDVRG
jgi:hypothetical protein